jgi:hypothetical protein
MAARAAMVAEGVIRLPLRRRNMRSHSLMPSPRHGLVVEQQVNHSGLRLVMAALRLVRHITARRTRCALILRRLGIYRIGWPSTGICRWVSRSVC